MTCSRLTVLSLALVSCLALSITPRALAQHDHGHGAQPGHTDDGHAHGAVAKATSFGEAARRIADQIKAIDAALAGGSISGVSDRANTVAVLARDLGALALAKDSGIAREQVKEANLAGKELAAAADALHEIADKVGAGEDLAASRAQFATVKSAAAKIDALAPATYFCPMFCEGDKTYDKPGACPVCGMKLKKQTSEQFSVEVAPVGGGAITAGKPVNLRWALKNPRGTPVKDLEIVHEMPLHLLMVSQDLSWFAHEHPKLEADGAFTMTWTFPAGGSYTLFHDFTPKGVGMQVVPVTLKVEGPAAPATPLVVDSDKPKTVDGVTFALATGGPIRTGAATHMVYTISQDGKPVTDLEPYLGAMGHLIIISQDLKEFVHSHPHEGGGHSHDHGAGGHRDAAPKAAPQAGGPKVTFEARFKEPGLYKSWAQFRHGGRVITVPFTFTVEKGAQSAAPVNKVCPMTGDIVNPFHTRDFKGQAVGFCDGDCAMRWDGLKEEERMARLVAAVAGTTPKTPHGAHAGAGHPEDDHAGGHEDMPAGVDAADERTLYLTPGGLYTAADIKANNSMTASEKYKGKMAKHDAKPKAGDKICPISMTKANPKFTWVIGGKTYEFCCPPCIDEFVLLAKTSPEEILDPSAYIKK